MIDLKNYNFIAGDTKVKIHKNALDNPETTQELLVSLQKRRHNFQKKEFLRVAKKTIIVLLDYSKQVK